MPRYPVAWVTAILFVLAAVATLDLFLGIVFVVLILPAVFFVQSVIAWVFRSSPVWLRRGVMLIPAFGVVFALFPSTHGFGGRQRDLINLTLAHHTPAGLRDMRVQEGGWTDTVIWAYFTCDPESLRQILEREPFQRMEYSAGFSFSKMPFEDLRGRPDLTNVVEFRRTDLEGQGLCLVYTDANFSFAYVIYGVD